jgi:2-isopropylmalate synthase
MPKMKRARISAFGMTRRPGTSASNDPGLAPLMDSGAGVLCLVGKTWDFHVKKALETTLEENLEMISDSIKYATKKGREVVFDAEHFFDGYKENPKYTLKCIHAAYESGARWVVLCDTNGGTLPHEISAIVGEVVKTIPGSHLGIHCHNDTGNAVANSLAAVLAGVRQVQGTLNGVGERCGNANLISIIPTLILKMGFKTSIKEPELQNLTKTSRFLDEKLNKISDNFAPYVGKSAFAHKGGLHVSAITKHPKSYEHIDPAAIGNMRNILISNQAGRANIISRLESGGFKTQEYSKHLIKKLVDEVKQRENEGYAYENADASFEVLAHNILGDLPSYFRVSVFRVLDERRWDDNDKLITMSEATANVLVGGEEILTVARGNGPVNALDQAIRKALQKKYPMVNHLKLVDYKVRIVNSGVGTEAITRVLIESEDKDGARWTTVGVSANIIDASYNALRDSITYKLIKSGIK